MGRIFSLLNVKKMWLFSATMCLCVVVFVLVAAKELSQIRPDFLLPFSFGAVLLVAVFCCLIWLVNIKKINTSTMLIIAAAVLSVYYMLIFPPITVPDEQAHYLSAYRISNYILFDFSANKNNGILMRECDARFFETLLPNVNGQYITEVYKGSSFITEDINKTFYECDFISGAPFSYLLSAFGISLARVLKLGALATFFAGRMMNIVGFTLLLIYAVKKIPYCKNVLPMIAALPITLHLTASFSYDPITLGFAIVYISQVLYIREKPDVANWKDILVLLIFAMLLAPSKAVYLPLVLLVFLIPNNKFKLSPIKAMTLKAFVVLMAGVVFFCIQLNSVVSISEPRTSGWTDEPPYSMTWALTHPFRLCRMLYSTFVTFRSDYIQNLFGGLLGWLDVELPKYLWKPHMWLVLFSIFRYKDEDKTFKMGEKIFVWMCLAASAGLIMLSLLVLHTPVGSVIIYGVQGRYFLPLLLPFILALRFNRFSISRKLEKYISVLYMTLGFCTVIKLFSIVAA